MATIYCLETQGLIWYVGSTTNVKARENQHRLKCEKTCNAAKIPDEYVYDFKVLETCGASDRFIRERYWIESLVPLYNKLVPNRSRKEVYDNWVSKNRERSNAIKAKYAEANRELINARNRARRAKKKAEQSLGAH